MLRALVARLGAIVLLAGLVVAVQGAATPARADYVNWGSTASGNKVMRAGCSRYAFKYAVHPPTDNWAAEIFLTNPRGRGMGSIALQSGTHRARGYLSWRLCRASLVPGRYRITMKVTYRATYYGNREGWVPPSSFRMSRPR